MPAAELISPELIDRVIKAESSYNPQAVSPKGARGLMQMMPDAWADVQARVPDLKTFGYEDFWADEETNRRFGSEYLKIVQNYLPEEHRGSLPHVLATYNYGIGNMKKIGYDLTRVPRETSDYIYRITGQQVNGGEHE